MGHDLFISYSSRDKQTADAVCHALETAGIRCWIAPRDVMPGRDWDDEIVRGIDDSQMMVLIFSAKSNDSKHVKRELHRAVKREIPIIPFRIEPVEPEGGLGFFLDQVHWLDALTPPLESHLKELTDTASGFIRGRESPVQPGSQTEPVQPAHVQEYQPDLFERLRPSYRNKYFVATACFLFILLVAGFYHFVWRDRPSDLTAARSEEPSSTPKESRQPASDLPSPSDVTGLSVDARGKGPTSKARTTPRIGEAPPRSSPPASEGKEPDVLARYFLTKARGLLERAIRGDEKTSVELANLYSEKEVLDSFRLWAEKGNAEAQFHLGNIYLQGKGAANAPALAAKWLRRACQQGNDAAQHSLGRMYELGLGLPVDYEEAARLYREAAEQGYVEAQYSLAQMYEAGRGVEKSYAKARGWYQMAAKRGHASAKNDLTRLGPGPPPDRALPHKGRGRLYALVVGVGRFQDPKIPALYFADKDAEDFHQVVWSQKGLFGEMHISLLKNEAATKSAMETKLRELFSSARKDDTVIVYVSGYATLESITESGPLLFLANDADLKHLRPSCLSLSDAMLASKVTSTRVLWILDVSSTGGSAQSAEFLSLLPKPEGWAIMTAARFDEKPQERYELRNSIFTHFLVKGMWGEANADKDGIITLRTLYDYAYSKTVEASKGAQHPQLTGTWVGEFPLAEASMGAALRRQMDLM